MGDPVTMAAVGLSLASTGVKVAGDYETSRGVAAGDTYRSEELQRAAEYGDLKASQVNAQMTRNLSISLAKLDSTRAAMHADPNSPTGAAVRDFEQNVGTENKNIKVTSLYEQAQQD